MDDIEWGKKCLERAIKLTNNKTPDLTSWCGSGSCQIVNYLLSLQEEED